MIASNTTKHDWHRASNECEGRCPLCGMPDPGRREHRAVRPDEGLEALWESRRKSVAGWKLQHFGFSEKPKPKPQKNRSDTHHLGIMPKTVARITRATMLLAQGFTAGTTAQKLGVNVSALYQLQATYPDLHLGCDCRSEGQGRDRRRYRRGLPQKG